MKKNINKQTEIDKLKKISNFLAQRDDSAEIEMFTNERYHVEEYCGIKINENYVGINRTGFYENSYWSLSLDSKDFSENIQNGKAALPPCHAFFQFYVSNSKLSCQLYQRSADVFLGVPFNIASYSLLTMMIAQVCNLKVGEFIHTFGDVHIYSNHLEQVDIQLKRKPRNLPRIKINADIDDIFEFNFDDFELIDYNPHPAIKAVVSI